MAFRDQHGAGHGTFGYDGNPWGVRHIIDLPSFKPLYQHPACPCCGVQSWWSTPEPQPCGSCKRGRVARNENEIAIVAGSEAPRVEQGVLP